jgi:predicted nucleotidyltransferase component of viral defense system
MNPAEDKSCYQNEHQRRVLLGLAECPAIRETFFLTGGTALAVWYLHHRLSNDLDLFSRDEAPLHDIDVWVSSRWRGDAVKLRETAAFLSYVIMGTKVDIVIDHRALGGDRPYWTFETGDMLSIDSVRNISSNKLATVVSRTEPKDFVDLFLLARDRNALQMNELFADARLKDATFDDPPTAAFQLEENASVVFGGALPFPVLLRPIDMEIMRAWYHELAHWLYRRSNTAA